MNGKWCVITGATSGIGKAAALALAKSGAHLVLVGRNERAGIDVVRRATKSSGGSQVHFLRTDLSVLDEVRRLAERIAKIAPQVDVLINNAGARFDRYEVSADGFEMTFATNYLGHFLLTDLLLDGLLRSGSGRIISVGSSSHSGSDAEEPWMPTPATFDRRKAYAKAKLANIMFAYEVAERLRQTSVTSNAVDPGLVATNFARNNGITSWLKHLVAHGLKGQLISATQGADSLIYLAASDEVHGRTGNYYHLRRELESSSASRDREATKRLWLLSLKLTGATNPYFRSASP